MRNLIQREYLACLCLTLLILCIQNLNSARLVLRVLNICEETTEGQLFIDLITHIITPVHSDVLFSCKLP